MGMLAVDYKMDPASIETMRLSRLFQWVEIIATLQKERR